MNDHELLLASLRTALTMEPDTSLPEKTQQEQIAGRARLVKSLRESIVTHAFEGLQRRFPAFRCDYDIFDKGDGVWMVELCVKGPTREFVFQEHLMLLPTDDLIAQLALIY